MRPLASSLMLALLMLPPGDAGARELDGEAHEVTQGDPQEWWLLTNGADLLVNGGRTYSISARDGSLVTLMNAQVEREHSNAEAIELRGGSALMSSYSRIEHGGIRSWTSSSVYLHYSRVTIGEEAPESVPTVGIMMIDSTADARVTLDASTLHVVDRPDHPH